MIKIEKIQIREFRGIRDLELTPKGQNFAACGPNGTGKSGIVDAIEFALTGNISRLSGEGTGDLSVSKHGPHVDFRNKPDQSTVTLEVSIPSLGGKRAAIHRSVKAASTPVITPADPDVLAALAEVQGHPEFVLSRRELIRYVISKPGDRAKEVQALLRLNDVEKLRGVLQKISNACTREVAPLEQAERDATRQLTDALGVTQLLKSSTLAAVNPYRQTLGVPPLEDIGPTISLTDGLASQQPGDAAQRAPKAQAATDMTGLKAALIALGDGVLVAGSAALVAELETLAADPAVVLGVKQEALLKSALDLYDDEVCPVCDQAFGPEDFTVHLKAKLEHLGDVAAKREVLGGQLQPLSQSIFAVGAALTKVIEYGPLFKPPLAMKALTDVRATLRGRYNQLQKFLPLEDTVAVLKVVHDLPDLVAALDEIDAAIATIPEPSTQDAARAFLTIGQERLEHYRAARKRLAEGKARADRAAFVFKVFADTTTKALETIYHDVQEAFADYYRQVNKDDESGFTAHLLPSIGKLGFDVDFYGRGRFPPGAYHSEGHQDGMGLCLYLALMNHLLGAGFTFAVLDDVLMSVDKGHRREVCALLKSRFPHTQFIFTTHDEVWLRHMKTEGIIKGKNAAQFRTWTVETGPAEWTTNSVWEEIEGHLTKNDVTAAAGVLRRYLEYFGGEASHKLRAPVEFRGDGEFMLGDTLPAAIGALGAAFKTAKSAANSWGQAEAMQAIVQLETPFAEARAKSNVEQWQINKAIHYNAWADLARQDFEPVVEAFRALTGHFDCSTCGDMLAVTPERGRREGLRCQCGTINLNFNAKPGGAKAGDGAAISSGQT
jgi:recombinational DNA repair ATPase RecF